MTDRPTPVLWVCGPPCVGKSTVGWEIFAQLTASGITAAYVDLAQIGFSRPVPDDDPHNHRIKARNLGAMWPTFQAAGARCLVISGGVEDRDDVARYAGALPGTALTLVRLHAGRSQLAERIQRRGRGEGPSIPGNELKGRSAAFLGRFTERAIADADDLEHAKLDALRVDTDGRSVADLAATVRTRAGGWPDLAPLHSAST